MASIVLTTHIIIKYYNEILPTLPTKQLLYITTATNLLLSKDSFINFVFNGRLTELIFYMIFTSLLLSSYIGRRIKLVIYLLVLSIIFITIAYDLLTGNPYHTFPHDISSYLEIVFLFLLAFTGYILIVFKYLYSLEKNIFVSDKSLIFIVFLIILILLSSLNLGSGYLVIDHVIPYILVYVVTTLLLVIRGVKNK